MYATVIFVSLEYMSMNFPLQFVPLLFRYRTLIVLSSSVHNSVGGVYTC